MQTGLTWVFDIIRNGEVHRTFSALQQALYYLAAARELCPADTWTIKTYQL